MSGKVVVITGAASGVGLETAKLLASKGAKVSLADVQDGPLQAVVSEITAAGGQAIGTVVDIRKRDQVEAWVKKTVDTFGKIDGAANIAGVISKQANVGSLQDIDDDDWDFVVGVNQKGLLNCLRAQIPHMNSGGSIVNAASIAGVIGFARNAAYVASKHAVVGLTKTAAKELGPRNIRSNCICPGPIETPMLQSAADIRGNETDYSYLALQRRAKPREIANHVEWLLSDGSSYITGTTQMIDGGWNC